MSYGFNKQSHQPILDGLTIVQTGQRKMNLRVQCEPGGIHMVETDPKFAQLEAMETQCSAQPQPMGTTAVFLGRAKR